VTIQALITCLVVNCKRMAKLLSALPHPQNASLSLAGA